MVRLTKEVTAVSSATFRSSRPDHWVEPRPYSDATLRRHIHGPVLPMERPGLLARLFGAH